MAFVSRQEEAWMPKALWILAIAAELDVPLGDGETAASSSSTVR
jgi:hypothetical protein